ncbi:MAG: T9SS C-terminal target domain-containing protein [Ignavibacteriales bacterium]|jgi:photosystem II stability/assembly factor-like uncharacterized protein|nr:MAG: T9SS C-terminal target domain-containing protein [Ignavibacteriales bacterium]
MRLFNKSIFLITSALMFFSPEVYAQYSNWWDSVPDQIRNKNSFLRYEAFYRPRTDETGKLPLEKFREEMSMEKLKLSKGNSKFFEITGTSDLWTNLGPTAVDMTAGGGFVGHWGNVSGRVRGVAVHPTDPDIVYIGAAAGGIWKTTDGGTSWADVSDDFTLLTFGAIAIDPNNPNTVYAGTGEARYFFNQQTYEGDGLYKSTDGGANWTEISDPSWSITQFSDIAVSPHNSNYVLVSMGSGNWNLGSYANEGVWLSTDGGSSWAEVITAGEAFDVAFSPTSADSAYAVIGGENSSSGFYISTNSGVSFPTQVTTFGSFDADTSMGRAQFVQSPSKSNIFYMLIYDSHGQFPGSQSTAAFKSSDGGATWSQISSGSNIAGSYTGASIDDQGSYDLCIAVNPTDEDIVYIGNVEISMTSDGSSFSFVRDATGPFSGTTAWDSPMHVDYHKIVYAPSNSNYIYVASDGGIHRTTNGGTSWTSLNNGVRTIQFYRVASHPTDASILFGGAQDNGNFSTTDKGATDWEFELTGDGMECFVDYNTSTNVFMSTQFGSLSKSTNSGSSWFSISPSYATSRAWTAPFWQDPGDHNSIYVFSNRLWKSTDKGASWTAISSDITTDGDGITAAAQSEVNTSNMMAAESRFTTSPELFSSTDGGTSWTDVTASYNSDKPNSVPILRIVADFGDGNTFYVCRASYGSGQILKTTNLGTDWTDFSGDLPSVPTNDIFIDPDNTNHIYVANDFGVYWSSDGGSTYTKLSNGMPFLPVIDFDFYDDGSNRYLRAASHGRGVYELNIDSPLPVELTFFNAELVEESVLLTWETATETNNYGFDVERSEDGDNFLKIHFEMGHGTSNIAHAYEYTDSDLPEVIEVWYRLKQIDNDGQTSYSKTVKVDISTITGVEDESKKLIFSLAQNYPNPFNPATRIEYTIPTESNVKITIVDVLGQVISQLVAEVKPAGKHEAIWNAEKFSSGIYIYKMQAEPLNGEQSFSATRKMIFTK